MTYPKQTFPAVFFRWRLIIAILMSAMILLLNACSKQGIKGTEENTLEQYFETNILNRDFTVALATDSSNDITTQYNGYIFRLYKSTLYNGPMTGIKNNVAVNGTWSCNSDYSKLTITLNQPAALPEFSFINRAWRFTSKNLPVMKLAPWGSTDPKVLHMRRL